MSNDPLLESKVVTDEPGRLGRPAERAGRAWPARVGQPGRPVPPAGRWAALQGGGGPPPYPPQPLQSSPPAGRRDRAAGLASPGQPGSASPLGRPAELAELVWDTLESEMGSLDTKS